MKNLLFVFLLFSGLVSGQDLYPSLFDQSGGIVDGYGAWGEYDYVREPSVDIVDKGTVTFYHPDVLMTQLPTVFFISGWANTYQYYDKYCKYISSLGYSVVHILNLNPGSINTSYPNSLAMMQDAITQYGTWIDTSKVGLVGHSYGAGSTIWLGNQIFDNDGINWGDNGSFIIMINPWYSFLIEDTELQNYPEEVKLLVIQCYDDMNTDPRIIRAMYQLISIPNSDKDFITIFSDEDLSHQYDYSGTTFSYKASHRYSYTELISGNDNPYDALDVYASNRLSDAMMSLVFEGDLAAAEVVLGDGGSSQIDMGVMPDLEVTDFYITTRDMAEFEYHCYDEDQTTWADTNIWKLSVYCEDLNGDGVVDGLLTSINEKVDMKFELYPNPAHDNITIQYSDIERVKYIKVIDPSGRMIQYLSNPKSNIVDVSGLYPGMYLLEISFDGALVYDRVVIY